jgi:acyl carrier protein
MIDEKYGIAIKEKDIRNAETIEDLFNNTVIINKKIYNNMTKLEIEKIVTNVLSEYCTNNNIQNVDITQNTPLIGSNRILDSLGLVHLIVDIETSFLDEDIELSLTSESAMSSRISPFRSIGSLCNFIAKQLGIEENG